VSVPEISIAVTDGSSLKVYLATPADGSARHAAVVVVQDALGLSKVIRGHADRLASYGYLAAAPDLFSRGGMLRCVRATFRALLSGQGQAFQDIESTRSWLLDRDDCNGKVGVVGFCMGGGFALMTASRGFNVSAPNYGPLPKDLDSALEGACPVVGSYGAKDPSLKRAATKLEAALSERDIPHDVKEYPDAGHSFLEPFPIGPLAPVFRVVGFGYHAASAEDAWSRIRVFFDQHLKASGPDLDSDTKG
jgi:carboxymethylenebutenolidase